MAPPPRAASGQLSKHLKSTMFTGFISLFPLYVTLLILGLIFGYATGYSTPIAEHLVRRVIAPLFGAINQQNIIDYTTPVVALIISILVIYVLGLLGHFVLGKRLLAAAEGLIENLPLIKGIYSTTKQVVSVFRREGDSQGFQRVVLVEFPRLGTWTVGFVTNTITDTGSPTKWVSVFIPMTPNPTSGFFQLFPESDIRNTDWSVDQGIKIVLSGGLLAPSQMSLSGETPTVPTSP